MVACALKSLSFEVNVVLQQTLFSPLRSDVLNSSLFSQASRHFSAYCVKRVSVVVSVGINIGSGHFERTQKRQQQHPLALYLTELR
ncbi:hypothetical protein ACLKA6_006176 [Drosophila palustris]